MTGKTFWLSSAAVAAFLTGILAPTLVAANPIPPAATYAELLEPVPDASARLAADDSLHMMGAHIERTQYWRRGYYDHHHHHHHHHHHSWQWYRDNGYYWDGNVWVVIPNYHHHHHYSQRWYRDNGYDWNGWAWTPRHDYGYYHHHHHHHHHYRGW